MSSGAQTQRNPTTTLDWHEPGVPAYHIESTCGRYTVSRMTVTPRDRVYYIAWRVKRDANNRIVSRVEIDECSIPLNATAEQRVAARAAMRQRCEDDAAGVGA